MDVPVTVLPGQALSVPPGIVVTLAVEDHLGAEVLHRLDLHRVGDGGRADDRAHAELPGGEGHGLAVVAGGSGDHASRALVLAEAAHQVDSAADLEGPGRVVVLVLHEHARPGQPVQRRVPAKRGGGQERPDLLGGVKDVRESRLRRGGHACQIKEVG